MDDPAPLLHVDWQRWLQNLANAIQAPLTAGMIPDIPFTKIAMTLSPRLLGRTTAGAGAAEQITVSAPLTLAAGALGLSTPLAVIYGGTGLATLATGDLWYGSAVNTASQRAIGSAGDVLTPSGGLPVWAPLRSLLASSSPVPILDAEESSDGAWALAASRTVTGATGAQGPQGMAGSDGDDVGDDPWSFAAAGSPLITRVSISSTITNDTTTNASMFPVWVTANTGNLPLTVSSTKLSFNPSAGTLTIVNLEIGGVAGSKLTQLGGSTGAIQWNGQIGTSGVDTSNPLYLGYRAGGAGSADLMRLFTDSQVTSAMHVKGTGRVGIGTSGPTAWLHIKAGTATASEAPLKFTSGTNLTTAEAGAMEYNGTNLFFTRAGTVRENVLVAVDNATAPTTSIGVAIVNYYGTAATNYLGDPNRWASINILGTVYKIPLYT